MRVATIDAIQIGNDQYELEHQAQGERTYSGTWEGLNGRIVENRRLIQLSYESSSWSCVSRDF